MQKLSIACAVLLFVALIASLFFLALALVCPQSLICAGSLVWAKSLDYTAVGELLLVAVLSLEGIVAVAHLREARNDRQADSLRDLLHTLGSDDFLDDRELIYKSIPWEAADYLAIGTESVRWERNGSNPDGDAMYHSQAPGGSVDLIISRSDRLWKTVHRVAERYQEAGLLCKRGYLVEQEFLEWGHRLPILRVWGRIQDLVRQEQLRRKSPDFWCYMGLLADAAVMRQGKPSATKRNKSAV
jgi:hypothetical protein